MKQKDLEKTNVMRILDQRGIAYQKYCYIGSGAISGTEVANYLQQDPAHVFKTLVTIGASGMHYVFVIPVCEELDLKKAAKSVNEKSIAMIKSRDLEPLTGYIHGGCSPIGMKKQLPTAVDETALLYETIIFSAGKIGYQVELSAAVLESLIPLHFADLTVT